MSRTLDRVGAFARAATRRLFAGTKRLLTEEPTAEGAGEAEAAAARELARSSGQLRAGMAKLAQLMAYHEGPGAASDEDARRSLATLWDHAPAMDAAAIRRVVTQDLGAEPEDIFAEWNDTPAIAAASLGQVHAALAHDGTRLAVKVQYPGVAEALRADLDSETFKRRLAGADVGRSLSPESVDALRDAVLGELDYLAEGKFLDRFRRAFRNDPAIVIPRFFPALSTKRVLSAERLDGTSIATATTDAAALAIFRFAWGAPIRHGLLNADPNPGNYILLDETRVGFVDFGCAIEIDPKLRATDRRLWRAVLAGDGESFRFAVYEEGLLGRTRTLDSGTYREWESVLAAPFRNRGPFTWTRDHARALADLTSRLVRAGGLALPPTSLLLWRQRLGVAAVLGSLAPTLDFTAALREILTEIE